MDDAARELLEASGWSMPDPDVVPTGNELVERYLDPLSRLPGLAPHIRTGTRAVAVTRQGLDKAKTAGRERRPLEVRTEGNDERRFYATAILDASGTYGSPNPMGSGGVTAVGEAAAADSLFYGIPDVRHRHRTRYAGAHVGVVGSGHSAFNTLLDLDALIDREDTRVTWFLRSSDLDRLWGGGEADQLSERATLGRRTQRLVESGRIGVRLEFGVDRVLRTRDGVVLVSTTGERSEPLDEVVVVTGFRPDLKLTRELRLALDPVVEAPSALAPLIDPNLHSCGTVPPHGHRELAHPEVGYYAVGMKSYGRAPTFLLLTGYEQVRSVVKALVGETEAADRVELCLPETGVCTTDAPVADAVPTGEEVACRS